MKIIFFILLIVSILSFKAFSADLEVNPMFISLKPTEKEPNKPQKFNIEIKSNKGAKISLTFYKATQNKDGYLDFTEMPHHELDKKIKIEKMGYTFPRAGIWEAKGTVIFEKGKKTTEAYAVMVEEDRGENKVSSGVGVSVRYAVILKIENTLKRDIEKLSIENFSLKLNKSKFVLSGMLKNDSSSDLHIHSYAIIRNAQNKLVKQVDLNSKAGWQKKDHENVIFPNSVIRVHNDATDSLIPGKYKVTIFSKISGKKQFSKSQDFTVGNDREPSNLKKNNLKNKLKRKTS